jgi:hypothetical protein
MALVKPILPTPPAIGTIQGWPGMVKTFQTVATFNKQLVQYLQNYLQQIYNFITSGSVSVGTPTAYPYTVAATDQFIPINGTETVNLPPSVGQGRSVVFTQVGVGTATIAPAGTDMINGVNTPYTFSTKWSLVSFYDYAVGAWVAA